MIKQPQLPRMFIYLQMQYSQVSYVHLPSNAIQSSIVCSSTFKCNTVKYRMFIYLQMQYSQVWSINTYDKTAAAPSYVHLPSNAIQSSIVCSSTFKCNTVKYRMFIYLQMQYSQV